MALFRVLTPVDKLRTGAVVDLTASTAALLSAHIRPVTGDESVDRVEVSPTISPAVLATLKAESFPSTEPAAPAPVAPAEPVADPEPAAPVVERPRVVRAARLPQSS
jgi:hypothetical protein